MTNGSCTVTSSDAPLEVNSTDRRFVVRASHDDNYDYFKSDHPTFSSVPGTLFTQYSMLSKNHVQDGTPFGSSHQELNCSVKEDWTRCPSMLWEEIVVSAPLPNDADLEKAQARRRRLRSSHPARHTLPRLLRRIIAIAIGGALAL